MDAALPAEKKKYIEGELSPLLDEMMAETIRKMPGDPKPFMLEWLENKKVFLEDQALTNEEREALSQENNQLHDSVQKSKHTLHETVKVVADEKNDEEEAEEEEDDAEDEPPPGWGEQTTTKVRQSVSAEAYGEWNQKKAFTPPSYPKNAEQLERLNATLGKSFLFSELEKADMDLILLAMKEQNFSAGTKVINEGDDGDYLFVIEQGTLDCIKNINGEDKVVKVVSAGDVFGELALLYNCPRAANVMAKDNCVCWQLDRETFNHIVKDAAVKRRNKYDTFLKSVSLISCLEAYERSQIADALKAETLSKGDKVITQGEPGDKFYILEEGNLFATKDGDRVKDYKPGDYFGELALLKNQPRAASVTVESDGAKVLSMTRLSFNKMLGPLTDVLQKNVGSYK